MKHDPSFDFRRLLTSRKPVRHQPFPRPADCLVGVAWSGRSVGLVALTLEAARGTQLRAYNNIAFGPVEADWERTSLAISRHLPMIFAGKTPRLVLGGAIDGAGECLDVGGSFECAFPGRVEHVSRDEVVTWVKRTPLSIALPSVSPHEEWALQPLKAAAETALFAGRAKLWGPSSRGEGR